MIEKIKARNLKGLSFEQGLGPKSLVVGPNGSGKSARAQALVLAINGYIPEIGKKNQATFEALASGSELVVEATINGKAFERMFVANEKSVSQSLRINKQKVGKDEFSKALGQAPEVLDLKAFLDSSDSKKINWLFKKFPPGGDVGKLESEIDKKTAKKNKLEEDARASKKSAQNLKKARAEMDLPGMTLALATDKIKDTEAQLKKAREDLQQAKQEERDARLAAEREAKARQEQEAAAKQKQERSPVQEPPSPAEEPPVRCSFPAKAEGLVQESEEPNPADSIRAIMASMDRAGCEACAAKLVCKRELKKFREVVPA